MSSVLCGLNSFAQVSHCFVTVGFGIDYFRYKNYCYEWIQVMFLVGLTLSALTVSTSDASFAGYVAKSAELSYCIIKVYLMHATILIHT